MKLASCGYADRNFLPMVCAEILFLKIWDNRQADSNRSSLSLFPNFRRGKNGGANKTKQRPFKSKLKKERRVTNLSMSRLVGLIKRKGGNILDVVFLLIQLKNNPLF